MSTQTEGKALIIQTVSVDVRVAIEARESDLEVITLDDIRERIENHVRGVLPKDVHDASEVYARRGPSGYRYFPPESVRSGQAPDDVVLPVTLTELGYEES